MNRPSTRPDSESTGAPFGSTHWDLILGAKQGSEPQRRAALDALLRQYWKPVYLYVRRRGEGRESARDLTQEFFSRMLERDFLAAVDPSKGRFRSFVRACLDHFLVNEFEGRKAEKRGGGRPVLSLSFAFPDEGDVPVASGDDPPDKLFDRSWALDLVRRAVQRLERELGAEGRQRWFEALRLQLSSGPEGRAMTYADIASTLGVAEAEVTNYLHRARRRLAQIVVEEVRPSVREGTEVGDEVRDLFAALS